MSVRKLVTWLVTLPAMLFGLGLALLMLRRQVRFQVQADEIRADLLAEAADEDVQLADIANRQAAEAIAAADVSVLVQEQAEVMREHGHNRLAGAVEAARRRAEQARGSR